MSDKKCLSISDCTTPFLCLSTGTCKSKHLMAKEVRASVETAPCRYADVCNEEGTCVDGCALRLTAGYMRHKPNELCECHDCHVARRTAIAAATGEQQ